MLRLKKFGLLLIIINNTVLLTHKIVLVGVYNYYCYSYIYANLNLNLANFYFNYLNKKGMLNTF